MGSGAQEAETLGSGWARLYRLVWWPLFLLVTAATLAGPYSIPRV